MSTIDLGLVLNGMDRRARPAGSQGSSDSAPAPLRVVLVQGEALRLPYARANLSVLTGTAWVTQCGEDQVLQAGQAMTAASCTDRAVVSALGTLPLVVEVR